MISGPPNVDGGFKFFILAFFFLFVFFLTFWLQSYTAKRSEQKEGNVWERGCAQCMMAAWGLHDDACFSCSMAAGAGGGEKAQLDATMALAYTDFFFLNMCNSKLNILHNNAGNHFLSFRIIMQGLL